MKKNIVTLSGIMDSGFNYSHFNSNKMLYQGFIGVKRKSGKIDKIPLLIPPRIAEGIQFRSDDKILIQGQFRTYNKICDGKSKLFINVFVDDIQMTSSSSDLNEVSLDGFICKKPSFRETPFGRKISDVIIAVDRNSNKSDYIPCIAWGSDAVLISRMNIGDHIRISGRIQSREYVKVVDGSDQVRTAYEVSVMKLEQIE